MGVDELRAAIGPVVGALGLELVDLDLAGGGRARTLRVTIDRDGGVDLDAITAATQAISPVLDATGPTGPYALEVSSPGLERPLREPRHFHRAVGATVSIKARGPDGAVTRRRGVLVEAGEQTITVDFDGEREQLAYDDVTQARTVFEWHKEKERAR
jgi:ribosome maturation factor RimP